jgi:SNF2 family DNA or RNA helicase
MRRMKSDVAKDLPRKIEVRRQCEMPDVQRQAFVKVRNRYEQGIEDNMLITIMNLRAVSDHPYLYKDDISAYDPDSLVPASARMIVMMEMLDEIRTKGEKVIVFVERKEIQRALQRIFYAAYGIVAKIINGDTPASASASRGTMSRQQSIDAFQAVPGFNIIIMSPVAAGMGLNVTAANHVIHYSRHWNPAKESQATDRAYRIGQQRDVYVYYPMAVCRDFVSFDMTLDELLSNKTMLATSTIFPTERTEVRQAEMAQRLFG